MHATLVIMAPLLIQSNNRSIWLISWNETVYEEEQKTGGRIGVLKLRIVPARLRFLPSEATAPAAVPYILVLVVRRLSLSLPVFE